MYLNYILRDGKLQHTVIFFIQATVLVRRRFKCNHRALSRVSSTVASSAALRHRKLYLSINGFLSYVFVDTSRECVSWNENL